MSPVAVSETTNGTNNGAKSHGPAKVFNPFYSPPTSDENDGDYQFANFKVSVPLQMPYVVRLRTDTALALLPRCQVATS